MIATCVHVWVKPEFRDRFIEESIKNHTESIKEPGNLRFDILQDAEDKDKFTFYEAYETEEAAMAHKKTAHYLSWRESVADWMAQPRQGIKHTMLAPQKA